MCPANVPRTFLGRLVFGTSSCMVWPEHGVAHPNGWVQQVPPKRVPFASSVILASVSGYVSESVLTTPSFGVKEYCTQCHLLAPPFIEEFSSIDGNDSTIWHARPASGATFRVRYHTNSFRNNRTILPSWLVHILFAPMFSSGQGRLSGTTKSGRIANSFI